jgi:hypothetical protein
MNRLLMGDLDPSDSAVQREIELAMLDRLGKLHPDWQRVTWKTEAAELGLPSVWQNAQPDATWKAGSDQMIVAECYARIGELKAGHRRKLAMDALKLLALRHALPHGRYIRFLLVLPEELTDRLNGDSWFPVAIRLAAEIIPVALLADEQRRLSAATVLQAQGQSRTARPRKDRGG